MENLTFEERLIKEHTPEPLEGHTVVVFKRVGTAGEKFHSLIAPGNRAVRPSLIRRFIGTSPYFAFAVDASPSRPLRFARHVVLYDHISEVDLVFELEYNAADPGTLASRRNADPLGSVRGRVAEVVAREVSQLDARDVEHGFAARGRHIVSEALPELRDFARPYGIGIVALYVSVRLPESVTDGPRHEFANEVLAGKAESDAEREARVERSRLQVLQAKEEIRLQMEALQLQHALEVAALKGAAGAAAGRNRVQTELVNTLISTMGTVAGRITTPEEFTDLLQLKQTLLEALGTGGNGADAATANGPTNGTAAGDAALPGVAPALLPLPASAQRLGGVLSELVAATQEARSHNQRQALRAAMLRVVADVLEDDSGGAAGAHPHAERAAWLVHTLAPAPASAQVEALRRLCDPDRLRDLLG
jgi:hypothetical protein